MLKIIVNYKELPIIKNYEIILNFTRFKTHLINSTLNSNNSINEQVISDSNNSENTKNIQSNKL